MDDPIQRLNQYQTYCVIPVVVVNVLPHHPIDAQNAQNEIIFRVVVCVLGLLGMLLLQIKKQQLKKASNTAV